MYIDAATYQEFTARDNASEATDVRVKTASRLLDSRVGNHVRIDDSDSDYDGYKLDLDSLKSYQKEIVQSWVSWMVAALYLNGDKPSTFANIKLGRFSVTENSGDENNEIPEQVRYADMQLKDAGLINIKVRTNRYTNGECI